MFVSSFHSLLFCQRKYVIKPVVICQVRKSDQPFCPPLFYSSQSDFSSSAEGLESPMIQAGIEANKTIEKKEKRAKFFLEIDLTP